MEVQEYGWHQLGSDEGLLAETIVADAFPGGRDHMCSQEGRGERGSAITAPTHKT